LRFLNLQFIFECVFANLNLNGHFATFATVGSHPEGFDLTSFLNLRWITT
jgi:hypothetical protein